MRSLHAYRCRGLRRNSDEADLDGGEISDNGISVS